MRRSAAVLVAFVLGVPAVATPQSGNPLQQMSRTIESLVERISPAVVEIFVTGYGATKDDGDTSAAPIERQSSLGSGVIVDPDGYIITNYHVIKGAKRITVLITPPLRPADQVAAALQPEPRSLPAKIVGFNKPGDLAVLKVDATGLPTVPFARYARLQQGQLVFAFGSPEGLQNSVSMGLVSSVLRQVDPDSPMVFIQTDAAINPGNSGGALVDVDGNLVGINSSILTQSGGNEGLGFAIPSGIARFVYEQIRQYGRVRRGEIGVDVETLTPSLVSALHLAAQSGVIVSDVMPDGPAEGAGLKVYDVVESINGIPIANESSFVMNMYLLKIGESVKVGIRRGTQRMTLTIPVLEVKQGAEDIADLADPETDAVPELGIIGVNVTPETARLMPEPRIGSGVVVAETIAGHRADDVGLSQGDIIHAVNSVSVSTLDALRKTLDRLKPGDPVVLLVERGGHLMLLTSEIE